MNELDQAYYKGCRINPISKKKQKQLREDRKVWLQILKRCGGMCEYCGKHPDWRGLHPHEEVFRSHCGEVSLENSKAACDPCHSEKHGVKEV